MISFIIFACSLIGIYLIVRRRYRLTQHDLYLQNKLIKNEKPIHQHFQEGFRRKLVRIAASPVKVLMNIGQRHSVNSSYLLKEADMMISGGLIDSAVRLLLQLITLDDKCAEAYKKLSVIYLNNGENVKAEYVLKKLLKFRKDAVSYSNLALALYSQSKLKESAKYYEFALKLDRSRSARFVNLGRVYHELKLFDKALECFERAHKLEPKNTEYLFIIVDYYERKHNSMKSSQYLQKILAIDPYNEEAKRKVGAR